MASASERGVHLNTHVSFVALCRSSLDERGYTAIVDEHCRCHSRPITETGWNPPFAPRAFSNESLLTLQGRAMGVRTTSVCSKERRRKDLLRRDTPLISVSHRGVPPQSRIHHGRSMSGKRLEELIDGRLQSAEPTVPLIWSAQTPWSGFLLERNVVHDGGARSILFPCTELIMVVAGSIYVEYRALSVEQRFFAGAGSVTVWPAGYELSPASWTVERMEEFPTEMLRVQLDMSALERLAPENNPVAGLRLAQQSGIEDACVASLMRLMEMDVAAGCPAGKLYGESLSLALAAHVAGHYSTGSIETVPRDGLARPVLTRVLDYIAANLGRDLTITELAAVANMSSHHFSLRFKRAVGVTPHQWVLRARVREAERLLRAQSMSVAEVALALGFASQTHFTDVFHRATGTTPRHYRRLC
jgi:AraC family transcriptional regulator